MGTASPTAVVRAAVYTEPLLRYHENRRASAYDPPERLEGVVLLSRRPVLKGCLIVLGVFPGAFFVLLLVASLLLNGRLPWVVVTHLKATDRQVVAARLVGDVHRDRLVSILQSVGAKVGLTPVAVTPPIRQDCIQGQHNWEINDTFDLQCRTRVIVVLGSTHASETALRTQLRAMDDQLAAHGWQSSSTEPIWPSIRMRLTEASNERLQPFLEQGASADYFHGVRATQGSDTISLLFTASPERVMFDQAPYGPATPDKGRAATKDTLAYLNGAPNRYVAVIELTYLYFSG